MNERPTSESLESGIRRVIIESLWLWMASLSHGVLILQIQFTLMFKEGGYYLLFNGEGFEALFTAKKKSRLSKFVLSKNPDISKLD